MEERVGSRSRPRAVVTKRSSSRAGRRRRIGVREPCLLELEAHRVRVPRPGRGLGGKVSRVRVKVRVDRGADRVLVGPGEVDEADGEDSRAKVRVRTGNNRNNNSKAGYTLAGLDSSLHSEINYDHDPFSSILSDQDGRRRRIYKNNAKSPITNSRIPPYSPLSCLLPRRFSRPFLNPDIPLTSTLSYLPLLSLRCTQPRFADVEKSRFFMFCSLCRKVEAGA
jgi:hypothetical protein